MKKVFVSGCYDLLHSGHVEFFRQAAQYGELYVGIGSDKTILHYKNHKTVYSEQERLFMVKSIKYVKDAYINAGRGILDFIPTLDIVKPDILVVNSDGGSDSKRKVCEERGIEYIVLERDPHEGLEARSSTELKKSPCFIPTRLDLAGTWIDQPYVSCHAPGWALTISLEPNFEIRDRCGLSTSTRNVIKRIWPYQLPNMDPETLARLVFCFENHPEREDGIVSGAKFDVLINSIKQISYIGTIAIGAVLVIQGSMLIGYIATCSAYVLKIMDHITQINNTLFQVHLPSLSKLIGNPHGWLDYF